MNKKTVENLIAAAVVCMTGTHAVADVATDMITSEAVFWFDASTLTAAAGTELNSWADAQPTNVGTVKFVCGDEGRTRFFSKKSDGLYLSGGFMLILR